MIDAPTPRQSPAPAGRYRVAAILAALLVGLTVPAAASGSAAPAPASVPAAASSSGATWSTAASSAALVAASTESSMAADILSWINAERVVLDLRPLRAWGALESLAATRAGNLASSRVLLHSAAGGDPGAALTEAGIGWYAYGEAIGTSSYPWGADAAENLYTLWAASPAHRAILFSATYNYVGVGIAQDADGNTWASILFTQSADHTAPWARNGVLGARGTSVWFRWSGDDVPLQSLTAGLRGFDVLYRVDRGAWRLIRYRTTATYLVLTGRAHRHWYSFRVRSADRRGNLSAWTAEKRIWLP